MEFEVKPRVQEIYDISDPNVQRIAEVYIAYLCELQKGRVKPDRNGRFPGIYDSLDNVPDIEATKRALARILNLDQGVIDAYKEEIEKNRKNGSNY